MQTDVHPVIQEGQLDLMHKGPKLLAITAIPARLDRDDLDLKVRLKGGKLRLQTMRLSHGKQASASSESEPSHRRRPRRAAEPRPARRARTMSPSTIGWGSPGVLASPAE